MSVNPTSALNWLIVRLLSQTERRALSLRRSLPVLLGMVKKPTSLADAIHDLGTTERTARVKLSNELVRLLSEQLYHSPLKAIEELVVNSYDADATECRVFVPEPGDHARAFVVVFDDGTGMDEAGLVSLWHIGRSEKRTESFQKRLKRKQIGKFGIGKLATYAIAHRVTYITRTAKQVRGVTLDFSWFSPNAEGSDSEIELPIHVLSDWTALYDLRFFQTACAAVGIEPSALLQKKSSSWTLSILEELKQEKLADTNMGLLRWVLSTAMPLQADFALYLNNDKIASSKEQYEKIVEFDVGDLPKQRLQSISKTTGEIWTSKAAGLVSPSFPLGVKGRAFVTEHTLVGKSDDLTRSNGFFIRVRGRLINEADSLFGLPALSHSTFPRFRADLDVDDLDSILTAPREGIQSTERRAKLLRLLLEVFNHARDQYDKYYADLEKKEKGKREHERNYVNPRLVEFPVADVLSTRQTGGAEADDGWFYLRIAKDSDLNAIANSLYTQPRTQYTYAYTDDGVSGRVVSFDPAESTFYLNESHDLVRAYRDEGQARWLLEDLVTAEALLEVYLRDNSVPPHVIGEVLEERDLLLRSLVHDHPFSLQTIAATLRDSGNHKDDLEVALVTACRALGFVTKHIAGGGQPDGIARLVDYPSGEKTITLEAKSSKDVPSLGAIDFAGLRQHVSDYGADGCLLVAPVYPGSSKRDDAAAAKRAAANRISCWTTRQLSAIVGAAEARHVTARQVLSIVLESFTPDDVSNAVERLLAEPAWEIRELYHAVLASLSSLEGKLPDAVREVSHVATAVALAHPTWSVGQDQVERALSELASASQGAMQLRDDRLVISVSLNELERRVSGLTHNSGAPRRASTFRAEK